VSASVLTCLMLQDQKRKVADWGTKLLRSIDCVFPACKFDLHRATGSITTWIRGMGSYDVVQRRYGNGGS
jgi:hypothetical protein